MMSCSMRRRSSREQNADCMPVTWIASTSPHPKPFTEATACTSLDTLTPLIKRLSVLIVARMPRRWNSATGWCARVGTAPICTLHVGCELERDLPVTDVGGERAEVHAIEIEVDEPVRWRAAVDRHALDEAHAVPDPLGSAIERVGDELETGRFARVQA